MPATEKVTPAQMAELCTAIESTPTLQVIALQLCAELTGLRQDAADAPDTAEGLRLRDKFLTKISTTSGQLDALKYVLHCIDCQLATFRDMRTEGYKQALEDLRVSVEAAQMRVTQGKTLKDLTPVD